MNDLDRYLSRYFVNAGQLAASCGITSDELSQYIEDELVPAPSYIVSGSASVNSFVFGRMEAQGSTDGRYFHPSTRIWVDRAVVAICKVGRSRAHAELKNQFTANLEAALAEFDKTIWRLRDAFTDDGSVIEEGLKVRIDSMWEHFLNGTFGLCVAKPDSERAIARKEILQEKLSELTGNGQRTSFSEAEAPGLLTLIDEFAEAAMPFSPVEYPRSSRKRLVEDLRQRIPKP
ncbi:MAG: DUF6058 family natural product biosynthesis protein [Nevskia sp.]|nr:DUF6058 family natural product biosynthesis protein [Nevskia sp.]